MVLSSAAGVGAARALPAPGAATALPAGAGRAAPGDGAAGARWQAASASMTSVVAIQPRWIMRHRLPGAPRVACPDTPLTLCPRARACPDMARNVLDRAAPRNAGARTRRAPAWGILRRPSRSAARRGRGAGSREVAMNNTRYEYSPIIRREPLRWPNGARVAVWVIPNIEHFHADRPGTALRPGSTSQVPDVYNMAWRDYGLRVGIWRQMALLDKYGIRATVALNAEVCDHYPVVVEEGLKRGWEYMG